MKNNQNIHIVLATDDNYAQHCAAVISSILLHSKNSHFDFHILDGGISEISKKKIKNIIKEKMNHIQFYNMSEYDFSRFPLNRKWISEVTYYRLILPDLLPNNVEKALYLDCDVICVEDISKLYNEDISDYYAAAAEDIASREHTERLHLPPENNYFNAGVMLFNLAKLRTIPFMEKVITFCKENEHLITMQDQDLLNGVLNGRIKKVALRWNINPVWQSFKNGNHFYIYSDSVLACHNPAILHFWRDNIKPWLNPDVQYGEEYWNSLKETEFYDEKNKPIGQKNASVSYKLFNFIPFLKVKNDYLTKSYYLFGMKILKVKKHINGITTKYLILGIPVMKKSCK